MSGIRSWEVLKVIRRNAAHKEYLAKRAKSPASNSKMYLQILWTT